MPQVSATGSSGMVFASEGVLIGFCLLNSFGLLNLSKCNRKDRRTLLTTCLPNLLVFLVIFFQIVLTPDLFLNVAPRVNSFVHGIAFLTSFLFTSFWYQVKRWLNSRKISNTNSGRIHIKRRLVYLEQTTC
jgi:hypothetical protein